MALSKRNAKMSIPSFVPQAEPIDLINPQPRTRWITVTPELSMKWLDENNTKNRTVRQKHVDNLAADMIAGKWRGQNGEAIRFDTSGRLVDGQHRLWASVQSKMAFDTLLVTGVDPEDYNTIGIGARKSFSDFLGPVHGEKNVFLLSAAIKLVCIWEMTGTLKNAPQGAPSIAEMEQTLSDHPNIIDSVGYVVGIGKNLRNVATLSYCCLIHYAGVLQNKTHQANNFLERLADGLGLTADDPIYHLRQFLLSQKGPTPGHRRAGRIYILALMIKAWNASKNGEKMKHLRFRGDEEFPTL